MNSLPTRSEKLVWAPILALLRSNGHLHRFMNTCDKQERWALMPQKRKGQKST